MSDLDDRLDSESEHWKAEEAGDRIVGEIVDIYERAGDWGPYSVVDLKTDDGEVFSVSMAGTILAQEFEARSPNIGDRLGIKYLGKKATKNGKSEYKNYRVVVERAPGSVAAPRAAAAAPVARP